ncbi:hypothetical protein Tco_1333100, partial [Tanacetum coccineum]
MSEATIASLKVRQEKCVLEAKVYRKWISKSIPQMTQLAFCCILIDREIVATSRYVVPTGRVKVLAGRYVVPTGKDNVIVSAGRTKVIPAGSIETDISDTDRLASEIKLQHKQTKPTPVKTTGNKTRQPTEAGQKITGLPCAHLMQKFKATDKTQLPIEMVNIIGLMINESTSKDKGVDTELSTSTTLTTNDSTNEDNIMP